jgi:hypothetical protein
MSALPAQLELPPPDFRPPPGFWKKLALALYLEAVRLTWGIERRDRIIAEKDREIERLRAALEGR